MTYNEIIIQLASNILQNFDEVFHSVEIIQSGDEKMPAYPLDDEWIDVVFSDTKETIYIRRNGDDEIMEEMKLSSCSKAYRMRTPLRIVYSQDLAKDHTGILFKLMQSVLMNGTKLKGIVRDKWKLQKDESSARLRLGASSAYFAIDIYAFWQLLEDTCEQDVCAELANPLKKELCPVVV